MIQSIITILTTTAVALHAMLGCCLHHAHACDSRDLGRQTVTAVEAEGHCSHGHHHHDEDGNALSDGLANDCGHEHHGGGTRDCDDGVCSFTSAQRSHDVEWLLTFAMWCHALDSVAQTDALESLLSLNSAAKPSPVALMDAGSARALSQVWRL